MAETELTDQMADLKAAAENVLGKAKAEARALTDDEQALVDGALADFDVAEAALERQRKVEALEARMAKPAGRKTDADETPAAEPARMARPTREPLVNVVQNRGTWDWETMGHFARAVKVAAAPGGYVDPRITARMAPGATTTSQEHVGADGGFAVPPDFRAAINQLMQGEDSLAARCDQLVSSSNSFSAPIDDTTPWQTTGGVLAYWEGESGQITQSKVSLKRQIVPLDKLTCLVPVTDELMEDAPALDSYLRRKAPEKMIFALNLAIIKGDGVGQPLGLANAGALVSAAADGAQTADTITMTNLTGMWTALYAPNRANAIWIMNQDCETQLLNLGWEGTSTSYPVYLPAGGLSASPYSQLLGRPVIFSQACETLGDLGDIYLADLTAYMLIMKAGGIRADISIHLWFDYDVAAFRFILRVGGKPWWDAAADARDGSATYSPYVTLAVRA